MKRHLCFIGFCLWLMIAHDACHAQISVRIGFSGGLNLADQSVSGTYYGPAREIRSCFIVEGAAEFGLTKYLFVQVEPGYVQKGMKWGSFERRDEANTYLGMFDLIEELSYFQLPLLLKAKIETGIFKPYAFIGPNIGILLSAKERLRLLVTGQDPKDYEMIDIKNERKPIDICLDFGAGAEYQISERLALLLSARYSFGLSNILDQSKSSAPPSNTTITSTGIQFMAGVLFNL